MRQLSLIVLAVLFILSWAPPAATTSLDGPTLTATTQHDAAIVKRMAQLDITQTRQCNAASPSDAAAVEGSQCMVMSECYDEFTGTCQPVGSQHWKNLYCEEICMNNMGNSPAWWQEYCYY